MTNLNIKMSVDDNKIISRTKKSLIKNFKITSYKQIDNAVWLALYLLISSKTEEAKDLLESFVKNVEHHEGREDLWGSNGNGILLLAYIYRNQNNISKETELVDIIINEDIMTDRTTRSNLLREEFEYHKERMDWCPKETHKYRCEILGERFFEFLYFYELLPTYCHELKEQEINKISEILDDITTRLSNELKAS